EPEILEHLQDLQPNLRLHLALEAALLRPDRVCADGEERHAVFTLGIRLRFAGHARLLVGYGDLRSRQHSVGRIAHDAGYGARDVLGYHNRGCGDKEKAAVNETLHSGKDYSRSALRDRKSTSELQSRVDLVCRLLLEKKKKKKKKKKKTQYIKKKNKKLKEETLDYTKI